MAEDLSVGAEVEVEVVEQAPRLHLQRARGEPLEVDETDGDGGEVPGLDATPPLELRGYRLREDARQQRIRTGLLGGEFVVRPGELDDLPAQFELRRGLPAQAAQELLLLGRKLPRFDVDDAQGPE